MNAVSLLRPIRLPLIAAIALQALSALLGLIPILALIAFTGAWLRDAPLPGSELVIVAVISIVGAAIAAAAATWLSHRADADLTWLLQRELADTIRRAPLTTITGQGAARIRKAVQDDTSALHYLVAHTVLDATMLIVTPIGGFIALAVIDWRLALASLVPLGLGVWWYVRAMRGSKAQFAEYAEQQRRINGAVVDFVRGLPTAKIYAGTESAQARYNEATTGFHRFFRSWSRPTAGVTTASWLVVAPALTAGMFALVGGIGLLTDAIAPPAVIAGVLLGPVISAPVAVAGPRLQAIRTGLSALTTISDFLSMPRLAWVDSSAPENTVPALSEVTVRYGDSLALDNITLELPNRGFIAVVGASGSGKSTLAMLLARFFDPDSGHLSLGDTDYRELREKDLYERVSFVFQDTALPDAPIRDILAGGRPISDRQMRVAAQLAVIDEPIDALPKGYDTTLGDDLELSGGQRQRLALARALLREPALLVLDETLSALDPITRQQILGVLHEQAKARTVLLIAHQLQLTVHADRILVLEAGQLVGDGHHADLLTGCAAYQRLWQAQMGPTTGNHLGEQVHQETDTQDTGSRAFDRSHGGQ
ncbi:MAG: ABC transporter ATP-binding protein [Gulosibacter sp.]|uniref:ABC transporter ATP-binding protein n=1 Tax=Gulosibacter sp. TaxID=2817531 RepID=UPI003F931DD2